MDVPVSQYLDRLGIDHQVGAPSVDLLHALQVAHLVHVPFENLDVYHRRGVRTDLAWSVDKVVRRGRGGWCFEVNGAFSVLLDALGFRVDRIECRVWESDIADWGPPFDHLALVVHLDGSRFLVDVGFGDNCIEPLLLEPGERAAVPRSARVEVDTDGFTLVEDVPGVGWESQLRGSFSPRVMSNFDARSNRLQTGDGLSWNTKPFATRALDADGSRVTLLRDVLRVRDSAGTVVDEPVPTESWRAVLAERFGLDDELR